MIRGRSGFRDTKLWEMGGGDVWQGIFFPPWLRNGFYVIDVGKLALIRYLAAA